MTYTYYPGCSAKGVGRGYTESLYAVFKHLGVGMQELEDWNCCGATAWLSVNEDQGFALSARNLALAEAPSHGEGPVDVVASCAGCYRNLLKAEHALGERGPAAEKINGALSAIGLGFQGRARTRHAVDILVNEIGVDAISRALTRPLTGVKVACYYGCLLVRPYTPFDDQHDPTSMDRLIEAIGADPVDWPLKTRCCGGSCYCGGPVIGVMPEATLQLSYALLHEAMRRGADMITSACPLCQFNLEGFQDRMSRRFGHPVDLPAPFITQLIGLALGIDERSLGIHRLLRWRLPDASESRPDQPSTLVAKAGFR